MAVGAEDDNTTWGNGLAHGIALRSGNLVAAIRTDCADPTSSDSFPSNCTTNPDGSHAAWDPETGTVHPIINRVLISSDSGRSFRAGGPTPAGGANGDGVKSWTECQVAELSNGSLVLTSRTIGTQNKGKVFDALPLQRLFAMSHDGGETWAKSWGVEGAQPYDEGFGPGYNCQAGLIAAQDGERLLLSHPTSSEFTCQKGGKPTGCNHNLYRRNLTVASSTSGGASWSIEEWGLVYPGLSAYSDMIELPNGQIGVAFERGTTEEYRFVAFTALTPPWAKELKTDDDAPPPPPPPPDASLKALSVGGGVKLTPAFSPSVQSYTAAEPPSAMQLTLTATQNDSSATMTVTGTGWPGAQALAAGAASPPVNLTVASAQLSVTVKSADGKASRGYTVTAKFPPSPPASVGLKTLAVTAAGKPLVVVPPFNSSAPPTTRYSAKVPDGIDQVVLQASTLDAFSSFTVTGGAVPTAQPPPVRGSGSVTFKLNSFQQGANFAVLGSDRTTTKSFALQLNSTVCTDSPISDGTLCPDTAQGAKCTVGCAQYYEPIEGSTALTCTLLTLYRVVNGKNVSYQQPGWRSNGGGMLRCGLKPPPPLPKGGTWKCMNGSSGGQLSQTDGNVTHNGMVLFNSTWFSGNPGPGCSLCDCCYDYVSDCEACASRCYETPTTHFSCGSPPPQDDELSATPGAMPWLKQGHPGPPPIDCVATAGARNPCLNSSSPGISTNLMQFSTSRCDGKCGAVAPPKGPFLPFPPPRNGSEWVCEAKVSNATSNASTWRCNVCDACCRDDVDCGACVKARCQPPGASFACTGGHCQPVTAFPSPGMKLFADPNCTRPLGGGAPSPPACPTGCLPVDPNQVRSMPRSQTCLLH